MHTKSLRLDDVETINALAKYSFHNPSRQVLEKLVCIILGKKHESSRIFEKPKSGENLIAERLNFE
jgi:hypothetical protein